MDYGTRQDRKRLSDTRLLPHHDAGPINIISGDTRDVIRYLPDNTFQCVITSPPYWGVRDYGMEGQIGAEHDLNDYITTLVDIFSEVRRVLRPDGTFWLNIGNTYSSGGRKWREQDSKNNGRAMSFRPPTPEGLKKKGLIGVAWTVAMACQKDGWYLRNEIIWHKPNCQPESVKDRLTVSLEHLFLFSKSEQYVFNQDAIEEPTLDGKAMKNRRSVWSINTEACAEAHFAVFPKKLIQPCVLAGTNENDLILDPFYVRVPSGWWQSNWDAVVWESSSKRSTSRLHKDGSGLLENLVFRRY